MSVLEADLDDPFDFSEINEMPDSWTAERLRRFAEWMGYSIVENDKNESGYSVISPSGSHLGGFTAASVIAAWQKNPNATVAAKGKGKGTGAKGAGAKAKTGPTAEEKKAAADAKKATTAEAQLTASKASADFAIKSIQPDVMAANSKGKVSAADVTGMVKGAQEKIAALKDPKAIATAIKELKQNISLYKSQATMAPPATTQLRDTIVKLKSALPDATVLAGTSFNADRIQKIIDSHTNKLSSAASPAEAQQAIKDMRTAISEDKIEQAKEKAAEAKLQKDQKAAAAAQVKAAKAAVAAAKKGVVATPSGVPATLVTGAGSVPKRASEWADYYLKKWYGFDESGDA